MLDNCRVFIISACLTASLVVEGANQHSYEKTMTSKDVLQQIACEVNRGLYHSYSLYKLFTNKSIDKSIVSELDVEYTMLYYKTLLFEQRVSTSRRRRISEKVIQKHDLINTATEQEYVTRLAELSKDRSACLRYAKYVYNTGTPYFWEEPVFAYIVANAVENLSGDSGATVDMSIGFHHILTKASRIQECNYASEMEGAFWKCFQALANTKDPKLVIDMADLLDGKGTTGLNEIQSMLGYLCPHIPPEINNLNLRGQWCRVLVKYFTWKGTVIPQVVTSGPDVSSNFFYGVEWDRIIMDLYASSEYFKTGAYAALSAEELLKKEKDVREAIGIALVKELVLKKAQLLRGDEDELSKQQIEGTNGSIPHQDK